MTYPDDYGPCPYCGVDAGQLCVSGAGWYNLMVARRVTTKHPHPERKIRTELS